MFRPSGSSWMISTVAPVAPKTVPAATQPEPFAQSTTTLSFVALIDAAISWRASMYRPSVARASIVRPMSAGAAAFS